MPLESTLAAGEAGSEAPAPSSPGRPRLQLPARPLVLIPFNEAALLLLLLLLLRRRRPPLLLAASAVADPPPAVAAPAAWVVCEPRLSLRLVGQSCGGASPGSGWPARAANAL
jgi:hypothetical protein